MIVSELALWKSIPGMDRLAYAFEFLEQEATLQLPAGKHDMGDDRWYVMVIRTDSRPAETAVFESHRKYVDIQYLVSGREMIGVAPIADLTETAGYDDAKDVILYGIPASYSRLTMEPGRFAMFFPEDGHMPNCHLDGPHPLHKVVLKIALDSLL